MRSYLICLYLLILTLSKQKDIVSSILKYLQSKFKILLVFSQYCFKIQQKNFAEILTLFKSFITYKINNKNNKILHIDKDTQREHNYHNIFQTKEKQIITTVYDQ